MNHQRCARILSHPEERSGGFHSGLNEQTSAQSALQTKVAQGPESGASRTSLFRPDYNPFFSFHLPTPSQLFAVVEQLYWLVPQPGRACVGSAGGRPRLERPTTLQKCGRCGATSPGHADLGATGLSRHAVCVTGRGAVCVLGFAERVRNTVSQLKLFAFRSSCAPSKSCLSPGDAAGGGRNLRNVWRSVPPCAHPQTERQSRCVPFLIFVSPFSVSIFCASLPLSQPLLSVSLSCVPSPTADE